MNNWIKKDLKYIWHPYTQMKDCKTNPLVLIEKGKGIKLYDAAGKYYYDTISSWWCNIHGHNHPKINLAIKGQLNKLEHVLFAGFTHKPAIELAERLVKITPKSLTKVFFSDNGSTAVETALKMSFQYWHNTGKKKKTKFVSFGDGYHGDTIGTMSISGVGLFNKKFTSLFFKAFKISSPADTGQLEKLLRRKNQEICAIIIEPLVMAAGRMIIYPKECLVEIAKLAKKYNIHLILDEVATGFGRTGKMFACQHTNIQPDFMCLSKGITAGYLPMGVTLTTDNIYNAFYSDYEKQKTFYHGHTYTANPITCAAANASLDVFKNEHTLRNSKKISDLIKKGISEFKDYNIVGDIRSIGHIAVIEIVKDKKTNKPFDAKKRIGLEIYKKGLEQNLILRPLGNIIYLFLPLCVNEKDINIIFKKMHNVFSDIDMRNIK
jgi:adenosylmethionine-8-amino-7-oxononanoate aminotransferase